MTIQRMDHVSIVVDDLEAAIAFFVELGMELEGEAPIEGRWVDRVIGLDGVRVDIAMMRTPDGHGRLELTKFHTPTAVSAEPENAPANTLGLRSIMFAVDDIDDVVAAPARPRRRTRRRGGAVRGQLPALLRPRPRGHHRRAGRAAQLTAPSRPTCDQPERSAGWTENDNGRNNHATERDHRGSEPTDQPGTVGPRPDPPGLRRQGRHTPQCPDRVHLERLGDRHVHDEERPEAPGPARRTRWLP